MSSKVLPEALHRALRSEDSAAFLLEVEDKLIALIALWWVTPHDSRGFQAKTVLQQRPRLLVQYCSRSKASSELTATEKQISFPAFDTFKRQCGMVPLDFAPNSPTGFVLNPFAQCITLLHVTSSPLLLLVKALIVTLLLHSIQIVNCAWRLSYDGV
jgi:hypothetical protein